MKDLHLEMTKFSKIRNAKNMSSTIKNDKNFFSTRSQQIF